MTVFNNRFAWEITPLFDLTDSAAVEATGLQWDALNTASKAGIDEDHSDGTDCSEYTGEAANDFSDPEGGCYPDMPREYSDEPGTDISTGLSQAVTMLQSAADTPDTRVVILLTDGKPNGLSEAGTARSDDGYSEDRWTEYVGTTPKTADEIWTDILAAAQTLGGDELGAHVWVVSWVADHENMEDIPQGDGTYTHVDDASLIEGVFGEIVAGL